MSNEANFTQGPWTWSADRLESAVDWVASPEYDSHSGWAYIEVSDDDKSLIAAAPELYEALLEVMDGSSAYDMHLQTGFAEEHCQGWFKLLAKARGEK